MDVNHVFAWQLAPRPADSSWIEREIEREGGAGLAYLQTLLGRSCQILLSLPSRK